jgi:hypothetical protein
MLDESKQKDNYQSEHQDKRTYENRFFETDAFWVSVSKVEVTFNCILALFSSTSNLRKKCLQKK